MFTSRVYDRLAIGRLGNLAPGSYCWGIYVGIFLFPGSSAGLRFILTPVPF